MLPGAGSVNAAPKSLRLIQEVSFLLLERIVTNAWHGGGERRIGNENLPQIGRGKRPNPSI
jgi:hypothetical protein